MRRRTASHCVFRQIGTSNGQLRVAIPKTPALSNIAGQFGPYLVLGDRSRADAAFDCLALRIRKLPPLESAISVIHSGASRVWTLPPLHAGHHWCVATQAERDAPSDCLASRSRKNAPMLPNRDGFRYFALADRLRVTTRSVLGEAPHNLRVLVVEMRHHSRCRQMDHADAPSRIISRPCTLRQLDT